MPIVSCRHVIAIAAVLAALVGFADPEPAIAGERGPVTRQLIPELLPDGPDRPFPGTQTAQIGLPRIGTQNDPGVRLAGADASFRAIVEARAAELTATIRRRLARRRRDLGLPSVKSAP